LTDRDFFMAEYSQTPLIKKLGIKPTSRILIKGEPNAYWDWVSPLPENVVVVKQARDDLDFIHVFVLSMKEFESQFLIMKKVLKKDGIFWISWPKKSSKIETDLDENKIRDFGLANGLVDVKVCVVDEVWSGLKFVYRIKDR
jgi:hypothetical protein